MKVGAPSFGAHLKALREAAGFTQEELATIAGLSVHAVSALERGERRRPHAETVRALSAALDLAGPARDAFMRSARASAIPTVADELTAAPLPLSPTNLLGREREVELLRAWLADGAARLITLVGSGGVGKTRLALELAREIADQGSARVVFVSLAAVHDPGFVPSAIAQGLGLADVNAAGLSKRVRIACEGQPTLLVLDNFEHLLDATLLIAELLTSVSSLRLLVTSRAPLHIRGEREYAVGPLALQTGAEEMAPAELARVPAVRLFVERVRDGQPDFRLNPANARSVAAICRRLDALPLALELAAPWLKVLTAEGLLRRLERDALLPAAASRDLPARQQTMNATVAWGYQLLDADQRRAFRCFGALPGRFPIKAAAAVLAGCESAAARNDEATGAVAALIDKSLLLRLESSERSSYHMLETVRAFAASELTRAGERDDALEGLVRYCASEVDLAAEGMVGPAQVEWLDRVQSDLESYRAAMTRLIEQGRPSEASRIAWGLISFWMIRGHAIEALLWYERILKLPSVPPEAKARALVGAGLMWYARGELGRARQATERGLALAPGAGDMGLTAVAELQLGHVDYAIGDVSEARDRFTRSLERLRPLAIPWAIGNAMTGLAGVELAAGNGRQAERLLTEAAAALRQAGPWYSTLSRYYHAVIAVRRGDADTAIALARESLLHIRELHDTFAFVHAMVPLAAAAILKGDAPWAARILGARDAVAGRMGGAVIDRSVDDLRDRAERDARASLGPDRWTRAYAAGRLISIDTLLQHIDEVV